MDKRKTVTVVALLLASVLTFSASAQAITMEKDSLTDQPLNVSYTEDYVRYENTNLDKNIPLDEYFIAPDIQSYVTDFNASIKNESENEVNFSVQYNFRDSIDVPSHLQDYSWSGTVTLPKGEIANRANASEEVEFTIGRLKTSVSPYLNNIILRQRTLDGGGFTKTIDENTYTDKDTDKVAFTGSFKKTGEDEYTQRLTQPNEYRPEQNRVLNIVNSEKAKVKDIDWNGMEHTSCDLDYYQYSIPKLEDANINQSFILNDLYGYDYNCYNITIPAESNPTIEITYEYDHVVEENGQTVFRDNPEFYTYILGSGAVARATGTQNACGTIDAYDTLIVRGTIDVCQSGATFEVDNELHVEGGGHIKGGGEHGDDAVTEEVNCDGTCDTNIIEESTKGEHGAPVTINTQQLVVDGQISTYGGEGGDSDRTADASRAGDGAPLDINAFRITGYGTLDASGGQAGDGVYYCDAGVSGDTIYCDDEGGLKAPAGDAGSIDLNATFINSSIRAEAHGGEGGYGHGGNFAGAGGPGTKGGTITAEAHYLKMDDLLAYGGDGRRSGTEYYDGETYYEDGGPGAIGGTIRIQADEIELDSARIDTNGGDGGDGNHGADGANGGEFFINGNKTRLTDSQFISYGGRGGDGEDDDFQTADGGDGGNGGNITITYIEDLVDNYNSFDVDGGLGGDYGTNEDGDDGREGEDGVAGTTEIKTDNSFTFKNGSMKLLKKNLTLHNQERNLENEFYQRDDLTVDWYFTLEEQNADDQVNISIESDDGTDFIDSEQMTFVEAESTDNGNYAYHYRFNYTIPENETAAGKWLVTTSLKDIYGNVWTDSGEFIYQYKDQNAQEAIQGAARVDQPIRFDQAVSYTNPSSRTYGVGGTGNVQLRFDLIDAATMNDIEVRKPDDTIIDHTTHPDGNYITWNVSSLTPGETRNFNIIWYMKEIEVSETSEVNETDSGRKIARQVYTFENPSSDLSLSDVELAGEFYAPVRTVDASVFLPDGTDITNSEEYGTYFADDDRDGFTDTAHFTVDSLLVDQPKEFTIVTDLGKPIEVYREPVITNRPVEPGKPIEWRTGFAFENNNDFVVPYNYRMRVPIDASDIRLEGQIKDQRFDNRGPYVLYEDTLPSNSNTTAFLRYETRSISTTLRTNQPDEFTVDEGATVVKTLNIENLVDQKIQNITRNVPIEYGQDLKLVDQDTEEVLDTQETVTETYTVNLNELDATETEELQIAYQIPSATSEEVRSTRTNEGFNLKVWEITSQANRPIEPVVFETDEIDCREVEEIRIVGSESNSTQQGSQVIDNWECGSTIVPLGDLQAEESLRLAIEYQEFQTEIEQTNTMRVFILGTFKWVGYVLLLLAIIETVLLIGQKLKINTPSPITSKFGDNSEGIDLGK